MPRKILVVNMNYLGDALMTTPALAALRQAFPDVQIDTIVGAGAPAAVLEGNPDLDHVIPRQARGSLARCVELYRLLRGGRYTDVVLMPPLPVYALTAWLARTPVRVGQAHRGMDPFLSERRPMCAVHMADAMLDTMPLPSESHAGRRLTVTLTPDDRAAAQALLAEAGLAEARSLVAVNLGATRPQKRWFAASFAAVLDELDDVPCVLIGAGPHDAALAEEILTLTKRAKPVNLVGRTGVKQLAAFLERCDVLLTADSGPMHLATAVGTPTVALFGSTDPAVTGPYNRVSRVLYKRLPCAPCGNHPTCDGRYDCMRQITPGEAALAVRELLRAGRPSGLALPMAPPALNNGNAKSAGDSINGSAPPPLLAPSRKASATGRRAGGGASPRILIVTKFRFIGDTLLAIPIFRAARAEWPLAHITLLTGRNARTLLQNNPYLDEIIGFDPNQRDRGFRPFLRLIRRLRGQRLDLCLVLNRSFHSALIPWLARVQTRAGFRSEGRSFLLNRGVPYEYDGDQSEVTCYFDVLRAVAPDVTVLPDAELWLSQGEQERARERLQSALGEDVSSLRLIGIQPGANRPSVHWVSERGLPRKRRLPEKYWPASRFARVADALAADDPSLRLILIGGPEEAGMAEEMLSDCAEATRRRVTSFVGRCDLRESLALVSRLTLFLGNDTAILHSAAALGVPVVALFGPTNPRKWGGGRPNQRTVESPNGTMAGITVASVLDAIQGLSASLSPCASQDRAGIIQGR